RSAQAPFCDGTHTNLPGGSPLDDPASPDNRNIAWSPDRDGPRTRLDAACYVASPPLAARMRRGDLAYCYLVTPVRGATDPTQVLVEGGAGASTGASVGDREVMLFVSAGEGQVNISGRRFDVRATDGVYVRPSEAWQLLPARSQTLKVFALSCPPGTLQWLESMPGNFDARCERRVVSVDEAQRQATGPRYFPLLAGERLGSRGITQFTWGIPPS